VWLLLRGERKSDATVLVELEEAVLCEQVDHKALGVLERSLLLVGLAKEVELGDAHHQIFDFLASDWRTRPSSNWLIH
jgi:hypothetical protein